MRVVRLFVYEAPNGVGLKFACDQATFRPTLLAAWYNELFEVGVMCAHSVYLTRRVFEAASCTSLGSLRSRSILP